MKKYFTFICILFYVVPIHAITSYLANYELFFKTNLGFVKVGSAEYELVVTDNVYIFENNAKTDKIWSALYDYSVNETSIGRIENNKFIGDYYKIIENQGDLISDKYEININELITNISRKSNLEALSDSELILKAIDSGNSEKIKFGGDHSLDASIPSYKKDLENREELIETLLELDTNPLAIVDALSVYLNISRDIEKSSNRKVFAYKLADKKGLSEREFIFTGFEKIKINDNDIETIRIECLELGLIINVSKDYHFMPVYIRRTNGKAIFRLILTNFMHV